MAAKSPSRLCLDKKLIILHFVNIGNGNIVNSISQHSLVCFPKKPLKSLVEFRYSRKKIYTNLNGWWIYLLLFIYLLTSNRLHLYWIRILLLPVTKQNKARKRAKCPQIFLRKYQISREYNAGTWTLVTENLLKLRLNYRFLCAII